MKIIGKISKHLESGLPFRQKLNWIYISFFLIPVILISFFFSTYVTTLLENQLKYSASSNYNQTLRYVESVLSIYHTLTFTLSRSEDFQYLHENSSQITALPINELEKFKRQMFSNVFTTISRTKLKSFSFYFEDQLTFLNDHNTFWGLNDVEDEKWYQETINHFGINRSSFLVAPPAWLVSNTEITDTTSQSIAFIHVIFSDESYWDLFGLVRADIPVADFNEILRQNESINGTVSYLINYAGEVVACTGTPDPDLLLAYRDVTALNRQSLDSRQSSNEPANNSNGWQAIKLAGQDWIVQQKAVGSYDLNLVSLIPINSIYHESNMIRRTIFLMLLFLGLLAGYFFAKICRSLTGRIQLLITHMRLTNQGQPKAIHEVSGKDELGQLIENYNIMVAEIQSFTDYRTQSNIAIRNYELKVLQEQINPHFLYNTLEMVNWLARNGQNSKVSQAVITLANFYRASLRRGNSTVTLAQELEHVRAYIDLQNMRYEDILKYHVQIKEEALSIHVPRIILQPIVENAILHGIFEKGADSGIISIRCFIKDKYLLICVRDDGKGILPETLAILNQLSSSHTNESGFGVFNVVSRIHIMYGPEYGLKYESEPGNGTTVTIRLPAE